MDKYTARLSNVLIAFIVILTFISGCTVQQQTMIDDIEQPQPQIEEIVAPADEQQAAEYVEVKYQATPVNLAAPGFEYHNTETSSFIRGAWYDKQHQYLVMNIDGTYYNYCGVPEFVWRGFKQSESYGRYFNASIKESFEYKNCVGPDY